MTCPNMNNKYYFQDQNLNLYWDQIHNGWKQCLAIAVATKMDILWYVQSWLNRCAFAIHIRCPAPKNISSFTASWHLTHACYATVCAFQILASFSFLVFSTDPYVLKEIQVTYIVRQYVRVAKKKAEIRPTILCKLYYANFQFFGCDWAYTTPYLSDGSYKHTQWMPRIHIQHFSTLWKLQQKKPCYNWHAKVATDNVQCCILW
jgi:hypothetical protein